MGLEVACVDLGGWDTHFFQGTTSGLQAESIDELALAAARELPADPEQVAFARRSRDPTRRRQHEARVMQQVVRTAERNERTMSETYLTRPPSV